MAVVADVFDVLLIDENGDVVGTTTLQDANIEVQVQENEVRGGKGNELLGVLHSSRDINISLTDVNFRYDWIAKQLGQDIKTGAGVAYAMPKWYPVLDDAGKPTVTLDETPLATGNELVIYNEEGQKVTGFTVSGNKIDFTSATPAIGVGDEVEVRTYKYATPAETQEIEIDNSVFAKGVKAILETVEVDESTEQVTHKLQYEFYNVLPTGNFTINTASERQAQTQEFSLRVVKPKGSTVVGKLKRIPITV
jgi:hypothetical protein